MDSKKKTAGTTEVNYVHRGTILQENIMKERKYEGKNFKYDFTFQPNNRMIFILTFSSISLCRKTPINIPFPSIHIKRNNFPSIEARLQIKQKSNQ